ncbi:MAG: 1,4-alpha-glucan branching enzyme, partial [Clostridia bacterium]|nr:1,4-alpha-glucan branching enzyme [Clostridia bacterium]
MKNTDLAAYLFHQGTASHAHRYMGAHTVAQPTGGANTPGITFRVWAPNAEAVSVIGDCTDWQTGASMSRVTQAGVWAATVPNAQNGHMY